MWLASKEYDSDLLSDMNTVLKPLLASNMFVTFVYAAWTGGADLAFSSAGHLPLLHYRMSTGDIEERSVSNLPLGILPDQRYTSRTLRFEPGDLLVLVTDGFTETSDSEEREFGMRVVKETLLAGVSNELREISGALRDRVLRYGEQRDDQTVLLIRRLS